MLKPRDWLLVFIGAPSAQTYFLDQVRVMKGMFLLSMEGKGAASGIYDFVPYHYGPFNALVYDDLEALERAELIRSRELSGTTRKVFELTEGGRTVMNTLLGRAPADALGSVLDVKQLVTSLSFLDLLRHVYQRYPAYAARSLARL